MTGSCVDSAQNDEPSEIPESRGGSWAHIPMYPRRSYSGAELVAYRDGFYCAISPREEPVTAFSNSLASLHQQRGEALDSVCLVEGQTLRDLEDEIQEILTPQSDPAATTDGGNNMKDAGEGTSEGDSEKSGDSLSDRISSLRLEIYAVEEKLAKERAVLAPKLVEESLARAREGARAVLEDVELLTQAKQKVLDQEHAKTQPGRQERVNWLKKQEQLVASSREITQRLTDQLLASGLTRSATILITSIGVMAQIATGWFFSGFAGASHLDSEDYLSFLIGRTLGALDHRLEGDQGVVFLAYVAAWVALLVLVGFVFWATEWLIEQTGTGTVEVSFDRSSATARIQRRPLFASIAWLLPFAFLGGLSMLVLSFLGPRSGDIKELLSALSGQFAGSAIALLSTSAFVVYLAVVVRPRLAATSNAAAPWRQHIELVVSLAVPLAFLCFLLLWDSFGLPVGHERASRSLAFFVFSVLLTTPTLGYGVWSRGVYAEAAYLERESRRIAYDLWNDVQPVILPKGPLFSKALAENWEERAHQLMRLASGKVLDEPNKPRSWAWFFGGSNENEDSSGFESLHFPHLKHKLEDLRRDLSEVEEERRRSQEKVRPPNGEGGGNAGLGDGDVREDSVLESARRRRRQALLEARNALQRVRLEFASRENALRDGFDLGTWYARLNDSIVGSRTQEELPK